MKMLRVLIPILVLGLGACEGGGGPSGESVVARAGGFELSAEATAEILAPQLQLEPQPEVIQALADLWVQYFLLAKASLEDSTLAQVDLDTRDPYETLDNMTFTWTVPTTGSPVVKYEVQIRRGGAASTDITNEDVSTNEATIRRVVGLMKYEVRVRAVDAGNRAGPWSLWSQEEDQDHEEPSF